MYDTKKIKSAIIAREKIKKACKVIVKLYSPIKLPESVMNRIYSRKKLYNFLDAIDLTPSQIQAIFWQYDLSVPRNTKLKPSIRKQELRPAWLAGDRIESSNDNDEYLF